jgi:hypothetical protein
MPSKTTSKGRQKQPIPFPSAQVARGFRARRSQIKRRLVELAGIQHRSERQGKHHMAARALKERRYLEFVIQLLGPASPKTRPPLRHAP